jgi:hypothetical protein
MTSLGAPILQKSHDMTGGKAHSRQYCLVTLIVVFLQSPNIATSMLYAKGHLSLCGLAGDDDYLAIWRFD